MGDAEVLIVGSRTDRVGCALWLSCFMRLVQARSGLAHLSVAATHEASWAEEKRRISNPSRRIYRVGRAHRKRSHG